MIDPRNASCTKYSSEDDDVDEYAGENCDRISEKRPAVLKKRKMGKKSPTVLKKKKTEMVQKLSEQKSCGSLRT